MHTLHPISWSDVLAGWARREEGNQGWQRFATEVQEWPDWRSWRMFSAEQMKLPSRSWTLMEFDDPMTEIPAMLIGPYSGWQSKMSTANQGSFADLIAIPKEYTFYRQNGNLVGMAEHFPAAEELIGLRRQDGKIVCIEGHHRSVCVALAAHDGQKIHFPSPVRIALAELQTDEGGLLDEVLQRGTTRLPKTGAS